MGVEVLLPLHAWLQELPLIPCSLFSVPLAQRCSPGKFVSYGLQMAESQVEGALVSDSFVGGELLELQHETDLYC